MSQSVRSRFAKAAWQYSQSAHLQRDCAYMLAKRIQQDFKTVPAWLDLGAGTGFMAQELGAQFANNSVALDLALPMLQQARGDYQHAVCADLTRAPFATGSFDVISANLVLQWAFLPAALLSVHRLLKPHGRFYLCVPLAGSLREIATLWQRQNLPAPINALYDLAYWQQQLKNAGFKVSASHSETRQLYYADARAALGSLKQIGAQHRTDKSVWLSKAAYKQILQEYQQHKTSQGVPLSYHIGSLTADKDV